ncbi:hypothetical protein [Piscinibacter sp.]|jgi:hypothetical protein|uniref:hypothetical protein n=1 Tax=Piscinibacter sp. TaxID=1903157 RepID=UPI002F411A65
MNWLLALAWRALRGVLIGLAALVLAIEEWGWRPLTAWAARLAKWAPLARLEARIRAAPPSVALALFLVPAVLLFPVKLLALWFIHMGRTMLGVVVIVAAKLLGTALVGRLFIITEAQLVQFAWFARALAWWRATKLRVRAALRRSGGWQAVQRARRRASVWLRRRTRGAR